MLLTILGAALAATSAPIPTCESGLYRSTDTSVQVALVNRSDGSARYMFADGRRGSLGEPDSLVVCKGETLRITAGHEPILDRVPLTVTRSQFRSHAEALSGVLIEAPGAGPKPLVVMVHGSERTSPRESVYPYIFAAHGLTVFAYDKRGTGLSEGEYTQNFELLADDAAAAFVEARRLTAGRAGRAGFFGGSQGGWVAPLAATRVPADFVAVGFGLLASPVEEDRDQLVSELRSKGFGATDVEEVKSLAQATSRIVRSHFTAGFEELRQLKQRYSTKPWFGQIGGEYTGPMLKMSDGDLRRVGRALYDNLELIWDYDSEAALRRVKAPILWVVAEEDREAPPELTLARLGKLRNEGVKLTLYSFPRTDHGMTEFREAADGSRTPTRITDGYFRLLADWIKGVEGSGYGSARKH